MNSRLSRYVKTKFIRIAQDLMDNPQGLKFKLESATEKLSKKSVQDSFGRYVSDLKTLIRMGRFWASRRYTTVDKQTVLYAVVAVIYFVTPTDFVPDFILGLGFIDDIGVLTWVLSQIQPDIDKFKKWENKKIKKEIAMSKDTKNE